MQSKPVPSQNNGSMICQVILQSRNFNSMVDIFMEDGTYPHTDHPRSRNHATRQRALQIICRPCRLISHIKNEKKKTFFSLFATNTCIFAPLASKQYCTEVNDYSFFQTIRHQSTKITPTPIPLPLSLSHLTC